MESIDLLNAITPDDTIILDGVGEHYLAVEALRYTGRELGWASAVTHLLNLSGFSVESPANEEIEEFQTIEEDPLTAQRFRGAIHDSLLAYLCSDQVGEQQKRTIREMVQWLRCQSAVNN